MGSDLNYAARYQAAIMDTFGPAKAIFVKGDGAELWDADGKRYLDGLAGIAVNALGHAHPALVAAIGGQVATLGHISNFFASPPQIELAERLLALAQAPVGSRVFFTNSGTEANEAAFKMARRIPMPCEEKNCRCEKNCHCGPGDSCHCEKNCHCGLDPQSPRQTGAEQTCTCGHSSCHCGHNSCHCGLDPQSPPETRSRVLALEHSFHGRSTGALALTYNPAYREPFTPLAAGVEFLPVSSSHDPLATLRAAFDPALPPVAALFVEPIQGEGGVIPLPPGYLQLARELTTQAGALLIYDEVQTGIGRTGTWFAHLNPAVVAPFDEEPQSGNSTPDPLAVQPDVMTLAKGLGGGFPIGAVIAFGPRAASLLGRGQHGTTFGGNPMATAAGLAVLDTIVADDLLANTNQVGYELVESLLGLENPAIAEVRGAGLLLAVVLKSDIAPQVAMQALELGLIVNPVAPNTIRIAPPLIFTSAQAAELVAILNRAINLVATTLPASEGSA
jgi:acetylornithine aminotransferase